jgi:hypothetical protein
MADRDQSATDVHRCPNNISHLPLKTLPYTAFAYLDAGLSLVPIGVNGTKSPTIEWKLLQTTAPTRDDVALWMTQGLGIAIIGGAVSGNLEILDHDEPDIWVAWCDMLEELAPGLLQRLPLVKTPDHGRHLYYRCDVIGGNQKLARRLHADGKTVDTLIETRGEGGYALSPLCPPGCHPLHKRYELIDGDLTDLPRITPEERLLLLQASRSFNEYIEPERTIQHTPPTHQASVNGDRPGDLYNARATWEEILLPHGWARVRHRGEIILWKRPGKQERGWSATTGYGQDLLYVFSTNAAPFADQHSYSKFAAYTYLEHAGDYIAAAKALYQQGYRTERQASERRIDSPADRRTLPLKPYGGLRLPREVLRHG